MATKNNSGKTRVTLSIDKKLWREFLIRMIYERGKQKEASKVLESLIRKYLEQTGSPRNASAVSE